VKPREHTREYGDHVPVLGPVVSLHHQLVGSRNQRQPVVVIERLGNVLAKRVPGAARRNTPAAPIIRVGPQQIAHGTFVRHFLDAVQGANVVQRVDTRRQTTVKTKYLVVDQGRERQVVEQVGKVLPHIGVAVLAKTLVVEPVHLRDLARLVVAAEDGDALRVADLEGHKQGHRLDRVVSSVHVIAC